MRKMIGRKSISLDDYDIIVIIDHCDLTSNKVLKNDLLTRISRRTKPQNRESVVFLIEFFQKLVWSLVSSLWVFSVDSWYNLCSHLHFSSSIELFFSHSAWISKPLSYKFFCENTINISPVRLRIRSVVSDFLSIFTDWSLSKSNSKLFEC